MFCICSQCSPNGLDSQDNKMKDSPLLSLFRTFWILYFPKNSWNVTCFDTLYETTSQYLSQHYMPEQEKCSAEAKSHKVFNFSVISCTYKYEPLPFPKLYTFLLNILEQFSLLLCVTELNIVHKSYPPHPTDLIQY